MKSNLRASIRKQIKKILAEKYEAGDTMTSGFEDFIKKYKNRNAAKKTKKPAAKRLKADSNGNLKVDDMLPQDGKLYEYSEASTVKAYYKKKYPGTITLIETQVAVEESPTLEDMFGDVSEEEQKIYNENYSRAQDAASSAKSNMQGDKDTMDALYTASNLCKIPLYTLYTLAAIESNGNQHVTSPSGNHAGLFQFGNGASKGAGFSSRSDVYNSSDHGYKYKLNNSVAACNFMKTNHSRGISKNIGLSTYSAYLMHQQGAKGSRNIYKKFILLDNSLIPNQRSNKSSIERGSLKIDTNRKWMIGWLGRVKGFEDSFKNVSGGKIKVPSGNSTQSSSRSPATNTSSRASWVDKLGSPLKSYPNFDSVHAIGGPGTNNNYRAGIDTRKANHNKEFFEELKLEFGIENVVTLNSDAKSASRAAKDAGLNTYYYPVGVANKLTQGQIDKIFELLDGGHTLVHCTHGADRTGEVIGRYYVVRGIMTVEEAKEDHKQYQGSGKKYEKNFKFIEKGKTKK